MNHDKYFILLGSLLILFNQVASTGNIPKQPLKDIPPNSIEFAWDAHQVLVNPNIARMCYIAIKYCGFKIAKMSGLLGYEYARYLWDRKVRPTHETCQKIYRLIKTSSTSEEYKHVLDNYDQNLWQIAELIAAEHYPISGIAEILNELEELGYLQRIATNMGSRELKNLVNKHPKFFAVIKDGMTIDFQNYPEIKKPNLDYFNNYHDRYNKNRKKLLYLLMTKKIMLILQKNVAWLRFYLIIRNN